MVGNIEGQEKNRAWDTLVEEIEREIDIAENELKDISSLLEQSEGQVEKLAARNATINMHLQKILNQIDDLPSVEIKTAYTAALDSQQRLVVMGSQMDKFKGDKKQLNRYLTMLKKVKKLIYDVGEVSENKIGSVKAEYAAAEMMIQAQEAERQRLSQKIHDGPAQTLSNFILQTEIALRLFDIDQAKAKEELSDLKTSAGNTFQLIRDFIFDLRPMMLDDLGLVPTVKRYIDAIQEKTTVEINLAISGQDRRIEAYLEVMVFRAMQELINFSTIQGHATEIKIQLDMGTESVRLVIEDNGKNYSGEDRSPEDTIGINMINERADMIGGAFEIDSFDGEGTQFTLVVPI